jgi:alpha-D-xyloside xylohydrolase
MYDFGEYVPADVVAADGTTGEELHNQYPVQYAEVLHNAMQASSQKDDWLAFMRSGYTGSSQYVPMAWSGDPAASFEDADGLPSMVRAGLNLGMSGVPFWGGDIGGYHCVADGAGAADEELLVRWIQQGALSPSMHDQTACVGSARSRKATLWRSHGALEAWRKYARLHTRLFPYLYSWASEAHERGTPLMRSSFFEHPTRVDLLAQDDAYYLGPALFVAPVVRRSERVKRVTLPDALYLDWDARTLVRGGVQLLDAPLEKVPLLLRSGQLVPLLDASIDTLAVEQNPDVIGPTDVAGTYDVVALLSPSAPGASLRLYDGTELSVAQLSAAQLSAPAAAAKAANRSEPVCAGCTPLRSDGSRRVRVSLEGDAEIGGLAFHSTVKRRIAWDVTVAERE